MTLPNPGIYQTVGSQGIRELVRAVYARLGQSSIAGMFPPAEALQAAADKSALFFIGICGGPSLYEQKYGSPRMRMRHQGFAITEEARQVWVCCWNAELENAVEVHGFPAEHLASFREYLESFSKWMVNRPV